MNDATTGDLGPGDEIVAEEWPTYFTQIPVWILLAGTSAQAYRMYAFLAEHINHRQPGRRIACPSTKAIARVLGLRDYRKVKPYRVELEQIGAIRVQEVRYAGGMRRSYRYFVRFNPPADHQGPVALNQFYELNPDVRSRPVEGRVRAALAIDGGDRSNERSAPAEGTVPPQTAARGGTSRMVPAASSTPAGDDLKLRAGDQRAKRLATTQQLTAEQLQVYTSFPGPLQEAMRASSGSRVPKTLMTEISRQLRDRSARQLCERVARRWESHRYRELLEAGQLSRPVGAAVAMLRHGECPDPMCEDGIVLDTGTACRNCAERRKDRQESRRTRQGSAGRGQDPAAAKETDQCVVCRETHDSQGDVCMTCRSRLELHVTHAAERAAGRVRASVSATLDPDEVEKEAERARWQVLQAAASGSKEARELGASDLGVLLAGQWSSDLAVSTAVREKTEMPT